MTKRKPSWRSDEQTQSMISGSVLEVLRLPLKDPWASKMPARNPLHHSGRGPRGHSSSSVTLAMSSPVCVRIALVERLPSVGNVIARTDLIRALGGFDEELPHLADWDLWIRLAHAAAGAPCPDVLVGYVDHPGNMFKSAGDAVMTEYDRIVAKHRAAREASGVKAGEVHFSRAIALMHLRAGRRLRASRAYLRGAVAHRSTGNLIRAGAALLGEDLMSRFSRDRALAAEEPAWVRLVWTAPSTRGPQPRRSVDGSAEPRPSEERRVGTATRSGSGS